MKTAPMEAVGCITHPCQKPIGNPGSRLWRKLGQQQCDASGAYPSDAYHEDVCKWIETEVLTQERTGRIGLRRMPAHYRDRLSHGHTRTPQLAGDLRLFCSLPGLSRTLVNGSSSSGRLRNAGLCHFPLDVAKSFFVGFFLLIFLL